MALLPESRKDQGLVMVRPLNENVTMAHVGTVSRRGVLQRRREQRVVGDTLKSVDARTGSQSLPVSSLSGGNQQKTALAKWLVKTPKLLLADEPTRGVDVGAKRAIYDLLHGLAADGLGVLLISSELGEVLGLAHRVIAVRRGHGRGRVRGGPGGRGDGHAGGVRQCLTKARPRCAAPSRAARWRRSPARSSCCAST